MFENEAAARKGNLVLETELQRVIPISGVCLTQGYKGHACVCSFPVVFISVIYSPALQIHLFFKEEQHKIKDKLEYCIIHPYILCLCEEAAGIADKR